MGTANFIWDDLSDNVMMETTESGDVTAKYTNNPGLHGSPISQQRGERSHYYHHDGDDSTRQVTDSDQMVTDTAIYSAYGEVVAQSGLLTTYPFQYKGAAGYYTDQKTGEIYVRARTYEPAVGRWLSEDPVGFVDGLNLYGAYFVPDCVDPTGEKKVCCKFRYWSDTKRTGKTWFREIECPPTKNYNACCFGYNANWKAILAIDGPCSWAPQPQPGLGVAKGVCMFITLDTCTLDPSDFVPPKWVCYAAAGVTVGIWAYVCCRTVDPCWDDYHACLLTSLADKFNRCWDCYLACSGLGEWRGRMNGLDCAYWNH